MASAPTPTSVAVYCCTHRRNPELRRLLESLAVAAGEVQPDIGVAVVVVDDNVDGRAESVVDAFDDSSFDLGLHYRHTGSGNISTARNAGLVAASELGEWVAMTDDDCVVSKEWLAELCRIQRERSADAVTGPMVLRFAPGSPDWLVEEPFDELGSFGDLDDGAIVELCATHNSMLRASLLREDPSLRFDTALGRLGGEDMVFYRKVLATGATAAFARHAMVWGEESAARSTLRYQLRQALWLGNSEAVTNLTSGSAGRVRLALRGSRRVADAVARLGGRLGRRANPQLRYTAALALRGLGLVLGAGGLRIEHR